MRYCRDKSFSGLKEGDEAPKTTWISKLQLHSLVLVVFRHIKRKNTVTSETQLWQRAHINTERYSHTQKVSFSPSPFLQNLFVRNGSRHWSFECEDIFPKHKTVLAENQALPAFSRPSLMHCL